MKTVELDKGGNTQIEIAKGKHKQNNKSNANNAKKGGRNGNKMQDNRLHEDRLCCPIAGSKIMKDANHDA